jgi:hypothetical protein
VAAKVDAIVNYSSKFIRLSSATHFVTRRSVCVCEFYFIAVKKISFAVIAILIAHVAIAQQLSTEERKFLIDLLEADSKKFLDNIENISDQQWNFKPSSDAWSVAQISEHITLSEDLLYSIAQKTLLTPSDEKKAAALAGHEKELLVAVMDRSSKSQAPEVLKPNGKFGSKKELIEVFKAARQKTINYVKTNSDPLKNHVARHPVFGELTAYQWLVFIAGHAERHVAQLEEVKKNVNFPKI